MYTENEKFNQLETQLRQFSGQNQEQLVKIIDGLQQKPLSKWFDLLSGTFIVAAGQGIEQATDDQATHAGQDKVSPANQTGKRLFKQLCEDVTDPQKPIAHYLNNDITMILEQSSNVKSWSEYQQKIDKQLLLSQLLYIWYLGWQRGYAFTVDFNMLLAKRQKHDPRLVKTTERQIQMASEKISETESTKILMKLFHDEPSREQVYLLILAYLDAGQSK